jgi:hypothetical protein
MQKLSRSEELSAPANVHLLIRKSDPFVARTGAMPELSHYDHPTGGFD